MFPNYIWDIQNDQKAVYLTFDDGPIPELTPWVLDQLKLFNAKATFFCVGANVDRYPEILKRAIGEGHTIGNHTYNHIKGWSTKNNVYLESVRKTQISIRNHQKCPPKNNLFRPPYGQITPKQGSLLKELGYQIIMWDIISFDWEPLVTAEICVLNVLNNVKPGSIIVFHDNIKASETLKEALPKVLLELKMQGFTFKSI